MRVVIVLALWSIAVLAPGLGHAADMLYIEYQVVAFGIDPASYQAMPRRLWRAGPSQLRLEEPIDPDTGEHRLVISSLPDIWYIDVGLQHGVHGRDASGKPVAHFPVFTVNAGDPLAALEMGMEAAYFADHAATDAGEKSVRGVPCTVQEILVDSRRLALYRQKTDGTPVLVTLESGEHVVGIRYLAYQKALPLDPALFLPPAGIDMEEAPPAAK